MIRVLVLNLNAARELVLSLSAILAGASSFEFRVTDGDVASPWDTLEEFRPNIVLLCLSQDVLKGAAKWFGIVRDTFKEIPVIVVAESAESQELYDLLQLGIADFLLSPLRTQDILPRLLRLRQYSLGSNSPIRHLKEKLGLKQFIGESERLIREIQKIPKVARSDTSVLIGGETGTGKEMFARAIHYLSPRSNKPFIAVNCGALPLELVENELFGHEAGAFTGASSSALGLIRDSDGGTLFLDEIDSLPLQSQVKLLRFLQEKEYRPLGSRTTFKADVRVIAASNANFGEAVRSGRFRSDLYYRLNVIPISLPSLRERKEDIPLLVRYLIARCAHEHKIPPKELSPSAMCKLMCHDWPGNIRELDNVICGALILSEQPVIQCEDVRIPTMTTVQWEESFKTMKAKVIAEFESSYVRQLLLANDGNITRAASAAKKNRRAFWQVMRKHHIDLTS